MDANTITLKIKSSKVMIHNHTLHATRVKHCATHSISDEFKSQYSQVYSVACQQINDALMRQYQLEMLLFKEHQDDIR
jgi:hypothetical protein